MAKKKTEIKQISKQKQTINITIGDKVGKKKRRGRPRKIAPKSAKGSGIVSGGFVAPIINYPPNYTNPAIVQPLQQQQAVSLVPKPPVGAPPKQPRINVFNEGETAPALGVSAVNPNELKLEKGEPLNQIPSAERLTSKAEEIRLARLQKFEGLKSSEARPTFADTAENALGGLDKNLGSAIEPGYNPSDTFYAEEPPSPEASTLSGYSLTSRDLSAYKKQFVPEYSKVSQQLPLPPIPLPSSGLSSATYPEFLFQEGLESAPVGGKKKKKLKLQFQPPTYPPPSEYVPATEAELFPGTLAQEGPYISSGRGRKKGTKNKPKEGISFLGSSRSQESAPPSLERQRAEAITPAESQFLSA